MKFISSLILASLFLLAVITFSCTKEDDNKEAGNYQKGIFITNEGPFQTGTGTITFVDGITGKVTQDIFNLENGRELGNVVQSMTLYNNNAYVVVNNASKIEVVNASSFKSVATITGLSQPRYLQVINDKKAYVSDWAGVVQIIDLTENSVTGSIPAGTGPEMMLKAGEFVYVLNAGGFSVDSTITIINSSTDQVVKTLTVAKRPTGIVQDESGKIWVLCSGKGFNGWPAADDTEGHLIRIDPETQTDDIDIAFDDSSMHPEKLVINKAGNTLYFLFDNGIYRYNTALALAVPTKVSHSNLYALAIDHGKNYLMTSDPKDFQSNGWMIRYDAESGALIDSVQAGVIPGNMVVKE
ncbi:MAG: hypothetical protein IPH45_17600 [Bacteroidales bacterium]|nr:hypothetical protein [Bacteroidales bacterium]